MSDSSFKRIFIVGCPRSGTTFLQSLLAAHPKLTSYPETHFWDYTIPETDIYRILKIYSVRERKIVRSYLQEHGYSLKSMANMKMAYIRTRRWSRALLDVLDALTSPRYSGWIEKTPRHLNYIPYISMADPDARFLHIIREGKDVVASMYEVTHQYPEHWNGPRSIDTCIERWKSDIRRSKKYLEDAHHSFVCYDQLVDEKKKTLYRICDFLNLEFSTKMTEEFRKEARDLVHEEEKWKSANIKGRNKSDKFSKMFTKKEQHYILEQIEEVSLDIFRGQIKKPVNSGFSQEGGV